VELPVTPAMMAFLGEQDPMALCDLLANAQDRISQIRAIARKGLENLEEKGLSTLYLAVGRATWTADDGGRDPAAPVLLIPINLKLKGQDIRATEIQVAGEAQVNPVLLHIFHKELNVAVEADELLTLFSPQADSADDESTNLNLKDLLNRLNSVAAKVPGFKAEPFAVIGNFSFQKLAMVKDLESRRSELLTNDVVAAIAGDNAARRKLGSAQIETDPTCLDAILPENEFAVVEADSSQQCALAGISAGQSAVVHGPPGTGKSQTITNLIAKRIFVVSLCRPIALGAAWLFHHTARTPLAHAVRFAPHGPPHSAVVQGLEVSRGDVLQHQLLQTQLRDQTLQLRVLLLQFLQPSSLIHLQTAKLLAPTVIGLFDDFSFLAGLR
jgi:Protein of unknown function (DUF4011)